MFAIKMSTGFTWSEVETFFKKVLPDVSVKFSHTNGPATYIEVSINGFENNREMTQNWVNIFYPKLTNYFGSAEVVELN